LLSPREEAAWRALRGDAQSVRVLAGRLGCKWETAKTRLGKLAALGLAQETGAGWTRGATLPHEAAELAGVAERRAERKARHAQERAAYQERESESGYIPKAELFAGAHFDERREFYELQRLAVPFTQDEERRIDQAMRLASCWHCESIAGFTGPGFAVTHAPRPGFRVWQPVDRTTQADAPRGWFWECRTCGARMWLTDAGILRLGGPGDEQGCCNALSLQLQAMLYEHVGRAGPVFHRNFAADAERYMRLYGVERYERFYGFEIREQKSAKGGAADEQKRNTVYSEAPAADSQRETDTQLAHDGLRDGCRARPRQQIAAGAEAGARLQSALV
jgi:hypothetical protein